MNIATVRQSAHTKPPRASSDSCLLQRKCACGGPSGLSDTCEACSNKKLLGQPLQAKLVVGSVDDPLEREADRVAEQVMRMPGGEPEHRPIDPGPVPLVQRRVPGNTAGTFAAPPAVHQVLSTSGRPLDTATRAFFEPRFGHNFSRVRVHTDSTAEASAKEIQAQAYTVGEHIVMGSGLYSPGTQNGGILLAHELSHVVQQNSSASLSTQAASALAEPAMSRGLIVQRDAESDLVPDFFEGAASVARSVARRVLDTFGPPDRSTIMNMAQWALGNSMVAPLLLNHPALAAHRSAIGWLQTDSFWKLIENPETYMKEIGEQLHPHFTDAIEQAQVAAKQSGDQLLTDLGISAEHRDTMWAVLKQVADLAGTTVEFATDIVLDTALFWELRSEHEIYDSAWSKYLNNEIDAFDLIVEHIAIVLNVVGRVEDLMPLVLAGAGLAAGGTAGGTAGTVVAPVAGTATGAGGGSAAGGASGLAVSEVLGLVAQIGPAALEVVKASKAAAGLLATERDDKQRAQDMGQIASSAFSILVMVALAFIPGLAVRVGRKLGGKLAREVVPYVDMLLAGSKRNTNGAPAPDGAPSRLDAALPDQQTPTELEPRKANDSEPDSDTARVAMDVEASVEISQHKSNAEVTMEDVFNEFLYIDRHPERIQGITPERRAAIGEAKKHEIVETSQGCERHSDSPIEFTGCVVNGKKIFKRESRPPPPEPGKDFPTESIGSDPDADPVDPMIDPEDLALLSGPKESLGQFEHRGDENGISDLSVSDKKPNQSNIKQNKTNQTRTQTISESDEADSPAVEKFFDDPEATLAHVNTDIPTFQSGKFNEWWDGMSDGDIEELAQLSELKKKIADGLRGDGGRHEFLMVSEMVKIKRWGISAKEIQDDFAADISRLNTVLAKGWVHTGDFSGTAHIELRRVIQRSGDLIDFIENMEPWAEEWIHGGFVALRAEVRGFDRNF